MGGLVNSPYFHAWYGIAGHVGVAVAVFLLFTFVEAGFNGDDVGFDKWNKISQDLCILGLGTTGGIFVSPEVSGYFAPIAGVLVAAVFTYDLFCAVYCARKGQKRRESQTFIFSRYPRWARFLLGFWDLIPGVTTVGLACGIIYFGTTRYKPPLLPCGPNPPAAMVTPRGRA